MDYLVGKKKSTLENYISSSCGGISNVLDLVIVRKSVGSDIYFITVIM